MSNSLQKFRNAHQRDFAAALSEMKSGKKRSHWMWYIFPQMKGLGFSETAQFYSITGLGEARDFLNDDYLGKNLREISQTLLELQCNDPHQIFGSPDDLKLKSSMTLFAKASENPDNIFQKVIEKYFSGVEDRRTLALLGL